MAASILNSRYLVWLILALPAIPFIDELINPSRYYPEMMQRSGILSIQLLVFTLSITPATLLMKPFHLGRIISRWLLAKRKYIGLASAGYAMIHTILYLRYVSWDWHLALLEARDWSFLTGWIAMVLFVIVAGISNRPGIKRLGIFWKPVQRLSYPIVLFGFLHWIELDFFIQDAMVWIVPLIVAKFVHVILVMTPSVNRQIGKSR